ncbi:MAG TPA: hypothetical protein VKV18_05580 [Chthonomonas sp.]|uniref:hypothetical protein n=1 Tax=Chthonomonas sp. TaxID=2282153 RepID=UPI002B4AB882|nr:hypothetical protein [Chthonomonas sp.]HLI48148.1 hypothetical protein [Chthonomonas sp.]
MKARGNLSQIKWGLFIVLALLLALGLLGGQAPTLHQTDTPNSTAELLKHYKPDWTGTIILPNGNKIGLPGKFFGGIFDDVACLGCVRLYPMMQDRALRKAFKILEEKHAFDAAAKIFQSYLQTHPNSIYAWIGLMQCSPKYWDAELKKLETTDFDPKKDPTSAFKLGMLLWYKYIMRPEPQNVSYEQYEAARRAWIADPVKKRIEWLLKEAWVYSHNPFYGIAYVDDSPHSGIPRISDQELIKAMLEETAGPKAMAIYHQAEANHWNGPVPDLKLIDPQKLGLLRGVIATLYIDRMSYGETFFPEANGKMRVVYDHYPSPEAKRQGAYLKRWRNLIDQTLKAEYEDVPTPEAKN